MTPNSLPVTLHNLVTQLAYLAAVLSFLFLAFGIPAWLINRKQEIWAAIYWGGFILVLLILAAMFGGPSR